ncbi:DNA-binding protein [Candidatus Bathyarchaeota archaeon]|nr:MAG: DNA-binding protein [Candidatus Bathyarchaeota archaeon]
MAQAMRDLKAARDSLEDGNHEWACFQAQQAAEKALKALLLGLGRGAWGHSLVELLDELSEIYGDAPDLLARARELDRHYIPARYPNAFESGYPGMYYDEEAAGRAISCAEEIMGWVREKLAGLGISS